MNHDDWNRGERVDYRTYHLSAPRSGYEWREVDGNYVMAAVATGGVIVRQLIAASTILTKPNGDSRLEPELSRLFTSTSHS